MTKVINKNELDDKKNKIFFPVLDFTLSKYCIDEKIKTVIIYSKEFTKKNHPKKKNICVILTQNFYMC